MTNDHQLSTRLVHAGVQRTPYGETSEALFLTSGFTYASAEEAEAAFDGRQPRYQYSRFGNPTVTMLEERLAAIEGRGSMPGDRHRHGGDPRRHAVPSQGR